MTEDLKKKEVNLEDLQASHRKTLNKVFGNSGVCSTAASTATKGVTVGNTFRLVTNAIVVVTFQNAINAANAKLAVTYTDGNGDQQTTTAKPIYYRGVALPKKLVQAGEVLILRYNGTQWDIIGSLVSDSGSDVAYVPTLDVPPTPQTTTYELDGETKQFAIGQFARVANGSSYDFYQLYDLKNNGTEAVWAGVPALIPSVYSAPTAKSLTYNTEEQALVNAGSSQDGIIYYSMDGEDWDTTIPKATNAGEYTVYWRLVGDSTHTSIPKTAISVTIAKAAPTYTAPSAKTLTYNESAQALLNAGSTSHGTIKYSADGETWDDTIPSLTNAGDYTVYWKLLGDANHTDVTTQTISVNIAKAAPTYTAPTAKSGLAYNGSAQNLLNTGSTSHGTIEYSRDNSTWSTSVPTATSAGSKTTYWRLTGDSNHTSVSAQTISVSIAKIDPTITAPTAKSLTYNGNAQTLMNNGSNTTPGSFSYSGNSQTNAGTYYPTWSFTPTDTTNYNSKSGTVTVTIGKANGSVSTAPVGGNKDYTGGNINLVTAGSGTGTMYYRLGTSGSFSTSIPTASALGTYTIYYKAAESTNYKESAVGSVTTSIRSYHNGYEFVDLGLPSGTKWATMNVGAASESQSGNYYMYGKGSSVYRYGDTKYTGTENPLSLNVDTARQVWGGQWHMPTQEQFTELINNCTWTKESNGYRGSRNGKSIFFPFSGLFGTGGAMYDTTTIAYAWTATPNSSENAYRAIFNSSNDTLSAQWGNTRVFGLPVRGVIG